MSVSFKQGHKIAECIAREYLPRNPKHSFDDLYQEAWIGILGANKQDETLGSLETYLTNAARNAVMNFVFKNMSGMSGTNYRNREKVAVMKQEKPAKILDLETEQIDAESLVQSKQACAQVNNALSTLGYDRAKVKWISAILLGEYRAREVAEAIGVDVAKVYQTMKDVKQRLKSTLSLQEVRK